MRGILRVRGRFTDREQGQELCFVLSHIFYPLISIAILWIKSYSYFTDDENKAKIIWDILQFTFLIGSMFSVFENTMRFFSWHHSCPPLYQTLDSVQTQNTLFQVYIVQQQTLIGGKGLGMTGNTYSTSCIFEARDQAWPGLQIIQQDPLSIPRHSLSTEQCILLKISKPIVSVS